VEFSNEYPNSVTAWVYMVQIKGSKRQAGPEEMGDCDGPVEASKEVEGGRRE